VIAYGCKLSPELCHIAFAINLHGSLLPKYRGAAPINWAIINGETHTGVSVITLAQRMDAGDILATSSLRIDGNETAGELHDRLALLGPEVVLATIGAFEGNRLCPQVQDVAHVSYARKLTKQDGVLTFDAPANVVRNRIHGLTPWPGCAVTLHQQQMIVKRASVIDEEMAGALPGSVLPDWSIACAPGRLRLLSVQPAGGKSMSFEAYARGRRIEPGMRLEQVEHDVAG
jgi:methionyl-tRNA formyltransferase